MYSNSMQSVTGMWYGDVPYGTANSWRTDLVGPPGLSKPSNSNAGQAKRGPMDGPPGFLADRNRSHNQQSHSHQQVRIGREFQEAHRHHEQSQQRPQGRSHSARRSRSQGPGYPQSPGHFGNGNHQGRRTPNRRNLTPVPLRSSSPQPFHHVQSAQPVSKPTPSAQRAVTPSRPSSASATPSTPEGPGALSAAAANAKAADAKPISAAAAAKLLEQAHKTPTQVVDNLTVTEQMAEKYHILQSEDGRTILFKKTPRGRRGGVKHRRKQAMAGEGIPEGSESASTSAPAPSTSASATLLHSPSTQLETKDSLPTAAAPTLNSPATSIPVGRPVSSEPELSTPPQPLHPPRPTTRELSPEAAVEGKSAAASAVASSSRPAVGLDAGMDDLMQELRELRAAKARAEEAQEQLTQQAQLLLQEKSQLVQQMAQKEKVIKNLEERLEFVQAECEDLRMATPNTFFNSLHEELGVDSEGVDSQTSAELHLLQALLSGNTQGGAHGMGAEGAAAVAAAIAQGQDGYYILDTTAAKPADALQYFDEQQGSTLLGTKAGIGASRLLS